MRYQRHSWADSFLLSILVRRSLVSSWQCHRLPRLSYIRNSSLISGSQWSLIEYLEKILNPSGFAVKSPSIVTPNPHFNIDGITQNLGGELGIRSQILTLGCKGIGDGGVKFGNNWYSYLFVYRSQEQDPIRRIPLCQVRKWMGNREREGNQICPDKSTMF